MALICSLAVLARQVSMGAPATLTRAHHIAGGYKTRFSAPYSSINRDRKQIHLLFVDFKFITVLRTGLSTPPRHSTRNSS